MNFTVYKSSAGSGKTFTLVREYLQLVLNDPPLFRHVLAITFTNKAANEMKQRILQALLQIGEQPEKSLKGTIRVMFDQIMQHTKIPEATLIFNAREVTRLILHNYSDFAISTIDSFVHRIIRSFSFDLHIPMNFEVELDTEEVLRRIIDLLINRAGSDPSLTELLVSFTQSKADDEKSWNLEDDIYAVAKLLMDEISQLFVKDLRHLHISDFLKLNTELAGFVRSFEKRLQKVSEQAMALIHQSALRPEAFYQGGRGIYAYFDRIKNGNFSSLKPGSYVKVTIDEDKWYGGKTSTSDQLVIDSIKQQLADFYFELAQIIDQQYGRYVLSIEVRKNLYPLAILHEIEKMLDEYRSENNILLISEFNQRIAAIALHEPIPFIYERVGEKYQHFLLDEFQDTSILQWQNLLPLIDNSLGENHFNMIVGDAKQAIYRWRSGEVEQFIELPKVYHNIDTPFARDREQSLIRNFKQEKLEQNYRSCKLLVDFNNEFFRTISEVLPEKYRQIYLNATQIPGRLQTDGFVHLDFYDKSIEREDKETYNLNRIKNIIDEVIGFNYAKSDIAILCRGNRNASTIASYLLQNDIPVISSESLLLSASPQVRMIVAVAKVLLENDDAVAKVDIIKWLSNNNYLTDSLTNLLQRFKVGDNKNTEAKSDQKDFFDLLQESGINLQLEKLYKLSVYEFCEEIIRSLDIHKTGDTYVQFFLDAVLMQGKDPNFDLKSLITWWNQKKDKLSIVVPEGVDAVRVMTIHKSKGLEFPVVIYPFATEALRKTKDKLWIEPGQDHFPRLKKALVDASARLEDAGYGDVLADETDKSLLDLINLLYVVLTRAADRLYIISAKPAAKSTGSINIPGLLKMYLEAKALWSDDQKIFTIGDPGTKSSLLNKPKINSSYPFSSFQLSDWRDRIALSLQAPEFWDIEEPGIEQEWGTIVHHVLAGIETVADIEPQIESLIQTGIIDKIIANKIKDKLNTFINHPSVTRFFKNDLKTIEESDILLPDGHLQRPDRLVFEMGKVLVIDYKSGSKSNLHINQVEKYKQTLFEMGQKYVEGFLLYINEPDPVVQV